ncbi:MAG: WD40 repeat domain-containing protein [Saprospiraceae bacterium]
MHVKKIHTGVGHRSAVYALAPWRKPGQFLSGGGEGWVVEWYWDAPEIGRVVAAVETQVFALAFDATSDLIIAGNMNGGLHFIYPNEPEATRNIHHHQKGVFGLLPLGDFLFSVGGDGILTRWLLNPVRSIESVHLSAYALRCISYCPQRDELAVGAGDRHIYLLDAQTLSVKRILKDAHDPTVFSVRYAPDGRYLLSGGRDAMLRVWDTQSDFEVYKAIPAHWFTLNSIVYSPDGALFATASRDKTIKIWDARHFELLKVLDVVRHGGHINSVNALLWMPAGLVSGSDDRTLGLWALTP